MPAKLTIECSIPEIRDLMVCGHCRDVTTLFRDRCLYCGRDSAFTVQELLSGDVDIVQITGESDTEWVGRVINRFLADASTSALRQDAA